MKRRAGVIGAGIWGSVIAHLLAEKGYDITLWCHERELPDIINDTHVNPFYFPGRQISRRVTATDDIRHCMDADFIVNALPVQYMRKIWEKISLNPGIPLINLSKGIEEGTLAFPADILSDCAGAGHNVYVLSGPSFAAEVYDGCYTAVVLAGQAGEAAEQIQRLFSSDNFRVYLNDDITGVELAGAMKNVIAIGSGIVKGIGAGSNTQSAIITRGVAEVIRLGRVMGAKESTFTGLAGFGDFILTCTNEMSRNFTFGGYLARGLAPDRAMEKAGGVVEGFNTLKSAVKLIRTHRCEMPITEGLYSIIFKGEKIEEVVSNLMSRKLKSEWD